MHSWVDLSDANVGTGSESSNRAERASFIEVGIVEKKDGSDGFRVNWLSIGGQGCLMKSRILSVGTGNRTSSAHVGRPITVA